MPKISELTSVSSLTGTEELPVLQSASTKKATVNDLLGYKVFTGLIAYNTVTEVVDVQTFRDDFGDLTFTKVSTGAYNITSAGSQFVADKTQVFVSQDNNNGAGANGNFVFYEAYRNNTSIVRIVANDVDVVGGTNTAADAMSNTSIEIRVYP
jgi:hypothetical protein